MFVFIREYLSIVAGREMCKRGTEPVVR